MEISHPQGGTPSKMLPTSSVRQRPNRILRILSESWPTLVEGKNEMRRDLNMYRVDMKLTQTNDISLLLNAIGQCEISKS